MNVDDFLDEVSAPARRALEGAGITTLAALREQGLGFARDPE